MYYKFPTARRKKPILEKPPIAENEEADEAMVIIDSFGNEQIADSKQEFWVYKGLKRIGIPFTYQFPIEGGRVRGGKLVDFVVHTVPLATMIEPEGNHWHTGELGNDDKKRDADVEAAMQDIARTPILKLWIPDMLDEDTVYNRLVEELT
jgi:hypothetical protein